MFIFKYFFLFTDIINTCSEILSKLPIPQWLLPLNQSQEVQGTSSTGNSRTRHKQWENCEWADRPNQHGGGNILQGRGRNASNWGQALGSTLYLCPFFSHVALGPVSVWQACKAAGQASNKGITSGQWPNFIHRQSSSPHYDLQGPTCPFPITCTPSPHSLIFSPLFTPFQLHGLPCYFLTCEIYPYLGAFSLEFFSLRYLHGWLPHLFLNSVEM